MADHGVPFLAAVLLWWSSTGAIIALCALPRRTFVWSLLAATGVAALALWGLVHSAWSDSRSGAYLAFACAIALWGWLEMAFLMGFVTGPRTTPCPTGASGWRRFRFALEALLYHELTIAASALLVVILSWGAPNQTGTLTFLVLLVMRISAKLNIFFGVPNLTDEFMPERLAYLKTYFRKANSNAFFPISISVATAAAFFLAARAIGAEATEAEAAGFTLVFTLLVLAIVEHGFMVMPLRDAALWRWAVPGRTEEHRS